MSRLIDADALFAVVKGHHDLYNGATNPTDKARRDENLQVMCDITDAPTIDAIPVEWLMQRQDEAYRAVYYCGGNVENNAEIMGAIRTVLELWQKKQEGR